MNDRRVIIICRNKKISADIKKTSLKGLLCWGSSIKQKYFVKHFSDQAPAKEIKARIEGNIIMPEWIGNHRFGMFDLMNYVINGNKYVYDPSVSPRYFDPIGIPSITSLHLYDYLLEKKYNPINIDNIAESHFKLKENLNNNPLAVIISATFLNAEEIYSIVHFVREHNNNVPVIIGGNVLLSKLDTSKRLIKEYEKIVSEKVYVILEEYGLDTLNMVLRQIASGGKVDNIPNLVSLVKGNIHYSPRKDVTYDIDSAYPDWERVSSITKDIAFIRSSHGCPFKCKFCTFPKASINFKQRSVESIRNELKKVKLSGLSHVAFTDDHFAINPERVREICKMMLEEKFDFNWFAGIRASAINEENAKLLEETGCKVLCVGLESGDDRMLKLINKKTTTALNMKALEILDKYNIIAYGSFLLGFPGETEESVKRTINWINSSPLKLYKVFLFYLFPGAIIYDEQPEHDITFLGGQYDYCLWKTPTMDALNASELLKDFILKIEKAVLIYNYSPMYAFFPLLSRGYSMAESLEFFRIRTDLIKSELSDSSFFSKRKTQKKLLNEIKKMLREGNT